MVWFKPMLARLDIFRSRFSIRFQNINEPKVQIQCHEHEDYHNHGIYNPITQHNNIKQTNETCQNNFTSPTYFLVDIFNMLEDPCVHVKTQNALIKGCKHQIIEQIILHSLFLFFMFFWCQMPKYSQNIGNSVEFTLETKKFIEFSQFFCQRI